MRTQRQRVAFVHGTGAAFELHAREELREHLKRDGARHQGKFRVFLQQRGGAGGMVRLHVMDDQVVRLAALQGLLQVLHPGVRRAGVGGVQDGDPVIQDDIGIIGHSLGHEVLAFKQIEVVVIYADVADGRADGQCH